MIDPTITCPSCKSEIKLTESLAAPLLEQTKTQFEQRLAEKDAEMSRRESTVRDQQAAIAKDKETLDEQIAEKLKVERTAIAAEEARKAKMLLGSDLEEKSIALLELQEVLKQRDQKLAAAQQAQADLIRKQRELDDAKREMDLTIEKRVQESLGVTRDKAKKEAEDELKLKVAERDQTILAMQQRIEELKRRSEQGSQQLQGEVQEMELIARLREKFPGDQIDDVPKGEFGGDVLQRVVNNNQQVCGTILWECKRTKNWSAGWLGKLRDDQRAAKADIAVIISTALPKEIESFDQLDGIWIASPQMFVPLAVALRQAILEVAAARQAGEGQQTKMELIYQYLTGSRFRLRISAIVEKFTDMQGDLEKERKTLTKLWAKREEQIRCAVESTAGMYGDLQGIAGKSLLEIDGLEIKLLTSEE